MLRAGVWNGRERLIRRRWLLIGLLTVAVVGLGLVIDLASPQPADWKLQARQQIAQLQATKAQMQGSAAGIPAGLQASFGSAIDQEVASQQYLIDHDVPPSDWYPAGRAISTILKTGFGFLLLLFGWLAAESVAQERSEHTLGLLLSRPVSRRTVLIGKAVSLQIVAMAVLSWLIAFNVVNVRNQFVGMVADFLYRVTEPALRPIRNILPNLGGIDISPVILIIGLLFLKQLIFWLYIQIFV